MIKIKHNPYIPESHIYRRALLDIRKYLIH